MMKANYKDSRAKLADLIKNQPAQTPIQEVRPVVAEKEQKEEAHLNFWIPEQLMDEIKIYAVRNKKSLKQIGIEALTAYLRTDI